jgi:hypothetical protein
METKFAHLKYRPFWNRYWSLIAAISLVFIDIFIESCVLGRISGAYEIVRAITVIVALALLIQSWRIQFRHARNWWRRIFWGVFIGLIAEGYLWIGLNYIRGKSYPNVFNPENLRFQIYGIVCQIQDGIILSAKGIAFILACWILLNFFVEGRILWKRKREKMFSNSNS